MKLEQEFTIPVEIERAWEVLLDVERVAPCFPGASLTSVKGDIVAGAVKVKLGPVLLTYNGVAEFKEKDAENRRVAIDARGTDTKGNGSATAQVTATLHPAGPSSTTCSILTDLNITGRPAQFGRGMMLEIGNKILGQFSDNLADSLSAAQPQAVLAAPTEPNSSNSQQQANAPRSVAATHVAPKEAQALDLLAAARAAALKRLAPVAAVVVIAAAIITWWATH
jgi:carbon monoxide dehydrogenase subunit G